MDSDAASAPAPADASALRGFIQAGLSYVEARSRLLQIEAHEAGRLLLRLVVLAVMAAGLLGGAWLLLTPVLVWWLSSLMNCSWYCAAGVLGAAHLVAALVLALRLRACVTRLKLFEETINQCRRDRECLGGNRNEAS